MKKINSARLYRKSTESWIDYNLAKPLNQDKLVKYLAEEMPGWMWITASDQIQADNDDGTLV